MKLFSSFFLILIATHAFSQITGKVVNKNNAPIEGVDVFIPNTTKGSFTDKNGKFSINIKNGSYTVFASLIGYKTISKKVTINNTENKNIKFVLLEDSIKLNDILIEVKTKAETMKEKPFAIESISTKGIKNIVVNANAVLEKISGINIRRTGGVGSSFSFSLNGMSGKQVKFFLDDIPLDNLGSSLNLDNFPVSLIDRIDVFKGVVPVYLGSDALGGAVNIVTNKQKKNYFDVSYGYGSFNTHNFSLLGRYQDQKSGFTAKILSFYNYSDNSYETDNIYISDNKNNIDNAKINNIKRKHDAFNSSMLNIQAGITDKKFTDELLVSALFSETKKELQHSLDYQMAFGEVETSEKLNQASLIYKKKNILKNLDAKVYASLSNNLFKLKDTSSYIYSWTKKPRIRGISSSGELGGEKSLLNLKDRMHLINSSLIYKLKDNHLFIFNYTKSFLKRTGTDKIPKKHIPFKRPHTLNKNALGLSYDFKLFEKKWNNSIFIKYYTLNIRGATRDPFKEIITDVDNDFNHFGYGVASTYKIKPNIQLKASFEEALRLPEGHEVFGDGALTRPNISLLPEKSNNFNFGGNYKTTLSENVKLHFDINGFYRKSENLIVARAEVVTLKYENAFDSKITGIETALNLSYNEKWLLKSNFTKLNISEISNGKRIKIPNIPFAYGNISLAYKHKNLFKNNGVINLNVSSRYVEGYPVASHTAGNKDKPKVKQQISHNCNINYSFNEKKYNISFSVNNILDSELYDNYKLQQPGRSFYLKLRYAI